MVFFGTFVCPGLEKKMENLKKSMPWEELLWVSCGYVDHVGKFRERVIGIWEAERGY